MNSDPELYQLAAGAGRRLAQRGWRSVVAESCTGGWLAKALTDVAGSSSWFHGGIVAYSNALKEQLLGVDSGLLARHGAVSGEVVQAMAAGAIRQVAARAGAGGGPVLAIATSGIAGPDGGTEGKPVGLVWFGVATLDAARAEARRFPGDREAVRRAAVAHALRLILQAVDAG